MLEAGVGAQRTEERVLERVLGPVAAEPPGEEAQDLVPVLLVERSNGGSHCAIAHL